MVFHGYRAVTPTLEEPRWSDNIRLTRVNPISISLPYLVTLASTVDGFIPPADRRLPLHDLPFSRKIDSGSIYDRQHAV